MPYWHYTSRGSEDGLSCHERGGRKSGCRSMSDPCAPERPSTPHPIDRIFACFERGYGGPQVATSLRDIETNFCNFWPGQMTDLDGVGLAAAPDETAILSPLYRLQSMCEFLGRTSREDLRSAEAIKSALVYAASGIGLSSPLIYQGGKSDELRKHFSFLARERQNTSTCLINCRGTASRGGLHERSRRAS